MMVATIFVEMQSLEDNFFYRVHIERTKMQRKVQSHPHIWLLTRILKLLFQNGHLYVILHSRSLQRSTLPVFQHPWYSLSSLSRFLNWEYLLCTLLSVFLLPVFSKHVKSLLPQNDLPPEKERDLENTIYRLRHKTSRFFSGAYIFINSE